MPRRDTRLRVEVARRLVGEQQRRLVDERPRDRDTLLLAAGELIRMMLGPIGEAHRRQRIHRQLASLRRRLHGTRIQQRHLDVLHRRRPRQQIEALEDEPDLRIANVRQLIARQLRDIAPVQHERARRRTIETAEDVHHRRFPRSRRPRDRDKLSRLDLERDPAQRMHGVLAERVGLGELLNRYQTHG
jgi:hypothetical protein